MRDEVSDGEGPTTDHKYVTHPDGPPRADRAGVVGWADQLTSKALNTRETEEWPCVYLNPLARSVFTWLGAGWKRG